MPATLVFLALRERLGHTVLALGEARLLEPGQRPAAVGVEVALLLGQRLVEGLVDERQRLAHARAACPRRRAPWRSGCRPPCRADGRLRQVHRRDVAALQVGERRGQLGLERGDELAARGGGRIGRARAADEDDAGGEGVGIHVPIMPVASSVRIGQVPLIAKPARITASRKVSQPVLAVPSSPSLSDCLKA